MKNNLLSLSTASTILLASLLSGSSTQENIPHTEISWFQETVENILETSWNHPKKGPILDQSCWWRDECLWDKLY